MLIVFTDEITQRKKVKYEGKKTLEQRKDMLCESQKRLRVSESCRLGTECFKQDRGANWSPNQVK